jgi:hypothetical protein
MWHGTKWAILLGLGLLICKSDNNATCGIVQFKGNHEYKPLLMEMCCTNVRNFHCWHLGRGWRPGLGCVSAEWGGGTSKRNFGRTAAEAATSFSYCFLDSCFPKMSWRWRPRVSSGLALLKTRLCSGVALSRNYHPGRPCLFSGPGTPSLSLKEELINSAFRHFLPDLITIQWGRQSSINNSIFRWETGY